MAHGGFDRSTGNAYSSKASDPTSGVSRDIDMRRNFYGSTLDTDVQRDDYGFPADTGIRREVNDVIPGNQGATMSSDESTNKVHSSGTLFMVVLGVLVLAIVVSIMVVNWARLIFEENVSSAMVLTVLLIANCSGLFGLCCLGCFRLYEHCSYDINQGYQQMGESNSSSFKKVTFLKFKRFFLGVFGLCYMVHSALYAWKHSSSNESNHQLGLAYNIITIVYVLCLFIYFATHQQKKNQNKCGYKMVSTVILISNVCIWLDTLFSESGYLFKNHADNYNTSSRNTTVNTSSRAEEVIEMTDPYLLPAMIEFSLMAIDMLFFRKKRASNQTRVNTDTKYSIRFLPLLCQLFTFLATFTLFVFTCIVLMTDSDDNDYPDDFLIYVCIQLILKLLIFALLATCIIPAFSLLTFQVNISSFVLLFSCFGNIVYHIFYLFPFFSKKESKVQNSVPISVADNCVSIVIALLQTLFLLGIDYPKISESTTRTCSDILKENFIHYACSLLGVINLGLWVCETFGEGRLPVFSIELYEAYDLPVWIIFNKLILPLTIFFRFHSGLHFLKVYNERYYFNPFRRSAESLI